MTRTPRLLLSAAIATALATTALTVTTAAPAAADSATRTYSCTFPVLGAVDVPLAVEVPPLPAEVPTGVTVPADMLPVDAVMTLPVLLTTALSLLTGGLSGHTTDFPMGLGDQTLPADLTAPLSTLSLGDPLDLAFSGGADEFVIPDPGDYPISLPESFDFALLNALGVSLGAVPCSLQGSDAGNVGTLHVVKQTSSMTAQLVNKPVRKGKRAQVLVAVKNQLGKGAAGRVKAMSSGKQVGAGSLTSGTVKLRLKKMSVGKHKVKLLYLGDKTTKPVTKNLKVKVKPKPKH